MQVSHFSCKYSNNTLWLLFDLVCKLVLDLSFMTKEPFSYIWPQHYVDGRRLLILSGIPVFQICICCAVHAFAFSPSPTPSKKWTPPSLLVYHSHSSYFHDPFSSLPFQTGSQNVREEGEKIETPRQRNQPLQQNQFDACTYSIGVCMLCDFWAWYYSTVYCTVLYSNNGFWRMVTSHSKPKMDANFTASTARGSQISHVLKLKAWHYRL